MTAVITSVVLFVLVLVPMVWIARAEIRKAKADAAALRRELLKTKVELQHEKQRHASCRKHHTFELGPQVVEVRAAECVWRDKGGQVIPMQRVHR